MENEKTSFLTVRRSCGPVEIKELGSRFIAYLHPLTAAGDADKLLRELWKIHHDATHVCSAWRLWQGGAEVLRRNDDGEPAGTAGAPIFNEILRRELFNVMVAVIRYFGGTKLGTGRLARTYARAARAVIDDSDPVTQIVRRLAAATIPFDFTGEMMRIAERYSILILRRSHDGKGTRMEMSVPLQHLETVIRMVRERSLGRVAVDVSD
jgi:putative IMPACT (imprinted ancient) family translation regulator